MNHGFVGKTSTTSTVNKVSSLEALQGFAEFLQHYERPDVKSHVTKSHVIIIRPDNYRTLCGEPL